MDLITVKDIFRDPDHYTDQKIRVGGWIRSVRGSKTFGFIVLNDGSSFNTLQIVSNDHA